mmetsp:Transcript_66966/g.205077  ORF Transcript_66966/g.205077 Transcript_66966/m.205077 type:complete len:272 (+) Transcript_66966:321-1136(+)
MSRCVRVRSGAMQGKLPELRSTSMIGQLLGLPPFGRGRTASEGSSEAGASDDPDTSAFCAALPCCSPACPRPSALRRNPIARGTAQSAQKLHQGKNNQSGLAMFVRCNSGTTEMQITLPTKKDRHLKEPMAPMASPTRPGGDTSGTRAEVEGPTHMDSATHTTTTNAYHTCGIHSITGGHNCMTTAMTLVQIKTEYAETWADTKLKNTQATARVADKAMFMLNSKLVRVCTSTAAPSHPKQSSTNWDITPMAIPSEALSSSVTTQSRNSNG